MMELRRFSASASRGSGERETSAASGPKSLQRQMPDSHKVYYGIYLVSVVQALTSNCSQTVDFRAAAGWERLARAVRVHAAARAVAVRGIRCKSALRDAG